MKNLNKTINALAFTAAVIVGVTSYIFTAFQLWWEENGDEVTAKFAAFVEKVEEAIDVTYQLGRDFRPVIEDLGVKLSWLVDQAFYKAAFAE